MHKIPLIAFAVAATGVASAQTLDDLSIATLFPGDTVFGNTANSSNDMSGSTIGSGSWSGGDDVYTLIWGGGDFSADLLFTHTDGDLDFWIIQNPLGGSSLQSSLTSSDDEHLAITDLAAGTYYLVVDGWQGATNTYTLTVVPAPSALALLGAGGLIAGRRRR